MQFKRTVLIFGRIIPKTEKVNTTIEFYIFELVYVPNLTLNKQFWILGPNLPKKGIYGQKWKNHSFVCVRGRYLPYRTY